MENTHTKAYCKPKQGRLPMFISESLSISDPVLAFDRIIMDDETPSYRSFGYFINEELADRIENIFTAIMKHITKTDNVDLSHIYIDGSKFEANANKYTQLSQHKFGSISLI